MAKRIGRSQPSVSRAERAADQLFNLSEIDMLLTLYGLSAEDLFAPTTAEEAALLAERRGEGPARERSAEDEFLDEADAELLRRYYELRGERPPSH